VDQNQDNVSERRDMSTCGLLRHHQLTKM
jgi:hypothetical protein